LKEKRKKFENEGQ